MLKAVREMKDAMIRFQEKKRDKKTRKKLVSQAQKFPGG